MRIPIRQLLAGVVLALALLAGVWAWSTRVEAPATPEPLSEEVAPIPEGTDQVPPTAIVRETGGSGALSKSLGQSTAMLVIDGTRYALTAPEGATLKEAMDRLQTESDFTYTFRDYAGLGAFVTGINARASTDDYVWILYVNGEKSATGISSTCIRSGDLIEWKLEKSY